MPSVQRLQFSLSGDRKKTTAAYKFPSKRLSVTSSSFRCDIVVSVKFRAGGPPQNKARDRALVLETESVDTRTTDRRRHRRQLGSSGRLSPHSRQATAPTVKNERSSLRCRDDRHRAWMLPNDPRRQSSACHTNRSSRGRRANPSSWADGRGTGRGRFRPCPRRG